MPPITSAEATSLCSEGYSEIYDFRMGRRKWMKQVEVFLLHLLNLYVTIPFALQYLETTGDTSSVRKRVDEVLLFQNSYYICLKSSIETGEPLLRQYTYIGCSKKKQIYENHDGLLIHEILMSNHELDVPRRALMAKN